MIASADLIRVADRHKRLVQDSRLFLFGDGSKCVVSSGNASGVRLRTVIKADVNVDACVSNDTFVGILKAAGNVDLSVSGGRLNVRGEKMRADVPIETGEKPTIPKGDESSKIDANTVETLRSILPKIELKQLEKSGQFSVRASKGELYASCIDEAHAALYYGESSDNIEFGIFPQDAALLMGIMANDNLSLSSSKGLIIIKASSESVVIPTTECTYIPKTDSRAKTAAVFDADAVKEVLRAIAPIAASSDASPVKISLSDKGMKVEVTGPSGSLSKHIAADVKHGCSFGVSHRMLSDIIANVSGDVNLGVFVESGEVVRVQIRSKGVTYATLTSSDK